MDKASQLEILDLTKLYGKKSVVDHISFQVQKGSIVGLLGHNGAGKTTVFSMLIGLQKPTYGQIFFQGENITALPIHERAKKGIGYLAQEPTIFQSLTVKENLLCALEAQNLSHEEETILLDQITEEMQLNKLLHNKAGYLSGGEKRRVEIARSLLTKPSIFLLDEPFANIDPITISELKKLLLSLKNKGITVIITDHNAREILSLVDYSIILNQGQLLFQGSKESTIRSDVVRHAYLGEDFAL